jgi:hypothetical protein
MDWMRELRKAKHSGNWARKQAICSFICKDMADLDWAENFIRKYGYDLFDLMYVQPQRKTGFAVSRKRRACDIK